MKIRLRTRSDVVRVARFYALQALEQIAAPGAIAVEPEPSAPALLFLVPPGSGCDWDVPTTTVLTEGQFVLPPEERRSPPGVFWLIPPSHGQLHTDVRHLRRALQAVFRLPELITPLPHGVTTDPHYTPATADTAPGHGQR
ncbi:hypothetical protein [Streptomyces sp. NBC_00872]|uniref:hypothetical protein n=1 Tax=Streptomyces sp. NBC_00872 TaxID=2903686 RepID=UPI003867E5D5|nr:hypothetical protein OG214_36720 [Streptomyces sp. NBC_00872]